MSHRGCLVSFVVRLPFSIIRPDVWDRAHRIRPTLAVVSIQYKYLLSFERAYSELTLFVLPVGLRHTAIEWLTNKGKFAKEDDTGEDLLEYMPYAEALAGLFGTGETDVLPAAVGIYAPWGAGKVRIYPQYCLGNASPFVLWGFLGSLLPSRFFVSFRQVSCPES